MNVVLLDTNAYSALLAADANVRKAIEAADEVLLCTTVLGELEAGFRGGDRYEANRAILEKFLAQPSVRFISQTRATTRIYGALINGLKKRGTPIPVNDVWIAASAVETQATLITFDKHFEKIPEVTRWAVPANASR